MFLGFHQSLGSVDFMTSQDNLRFTTLGEVALRRLVFPWRVAFWKTPAQIISSWLCNTEAWCCVCWHLLTWFWWLEDLILHWFWFCIGFDSVLILIWKPSQTYQSLCSDKWWGAAIDMLQPQMTSSAWWRNTLGMQSWAKNHCWLWQGHKLRASPTFQPNDILWGLSLIKWKKTGGSWLPQLKPSMVIPTSQLPSICETCLQIPSTTTASWRIYHGCTKMVLDMWANLCSIYTNVYWTH